MNIFTNYITNKYITIDGRMRSPMDEWNNKKQNHVKKVSPQVKQLHRNKKIINRNLWYDTEKKRKILSSIIILKWYQGPTDFSIINKKQNCVWFFKEGKSF